MTTLGLKNINMMSREQFEDVSEPVQDELYAISGSGFGFPSSNYEDLELGASGTEYVAPANGWFVLNKLSSSTNQYANFANLTNGMNISIMLPNTNSNIRIYMPVLKGHVVTCSYSAAGATQYFRFIYAEGE